ncbi:MAG: AAA family ATPase, partial [Dehalococcoidia bacterium]
MRCSNCGRDNRPDAAFCDSCGTRLIAPSESGSAGESPKVAEGGFVGRHREMDQLIAAWEQSSSGHGRLVLLVGEPGIGKTRIAQELTAYAQSEGARVLWGRCYAEEGAPAYWPWMQMLRSYLEGVDSQQVRSDLAPGAADIAAIVPEVRDQLPGLEPPPIMEPDQARFRLFESVVHFFQHLARAQPLLLVLDDLHWADRPSLLLLQFLAQQMAHTRLLIV